MIEASADPTAALDASPDGQAAAADLGPWTTDKEPSGTWTWGPADECCAPLPRRGQRTCVHGTPPASPPACEPPAASCSSATERVLTCAGALRYLRPSVATETIACLRDEWGCDGQPGVFHCAERSLLRECEDGPVDDPCGAIAGACPALSRRACGAWLSGMNDDGRARMVACLTTPTGCAQGPAACATDLLSGRAGCAQRPVTATATIDVKAPPPGDPQRAPLGSAVATLRIPALRITRTLFDVVGTDRSHCKRTRGWNEEGMLQEGVECLALQEMGTASLGVRRGKLVVDLGRRSATPEEIDLPCGARVSVVVTGVR